MLIYLYGPDSYRRLEKLNSLVSEYRGKHSSLTLDHFDLEQEGEFERLKVFASGQSLFGESKLGVIHDAEEGGKEAAEFLKPLAQNKNSTFIVVSDQKPTKEFQFLLKKPVLAIEFEPLKDAELYAFIKKEAEVRGVKISPALIENLALTSSGDAWTIVTELEKIALGGKPEEHLAAPQFFPLIQRLKGHWPLKEKLSALAYLLENEEPAAVFNVTASVADPALKVKMADYDVAVKSGKLEYEEVLLDLVISN